MFSGTANVAKFFKRLNYQIISCDLMNYSYVLQQAYIKNNSVPTFDCLLSKLPLDVDTPLNTTPLQTVLSYLNGLPNQQGFVYQNYTPDGSRGLNQPRMYYTADNGMFIDKVRTQIQHWFDNGDINENEFYILCTALIETVPFYANISGVYAAFNKTWDRRALKPMKLREPEIIINDKQNQCFQTNSCDLISDIQADVFYLDPPYNQRQYAPNYHLLETIALYDNPNIKGVSGMRDYSEQKSRFCNHKTALEDLAYIANNGKYQHLLLSYNNEGIMKHDDILGVLKESGAVINVIDFEYQRFKSNSQTEGYKVKELLYVASR